VSCGVQEPEGSYRTVPNPARGGAWRGARMCHVCCLCFVLIYINCFIFGKFYTILGRAVALI
jgi:hypothetical protein